MITFGYREKYSGIARAVFAIIVGAVMVSVKANVLNMVVQFIGAVLAVKGLFAFVLTLLDKDNSGFGVALLGTVVRVALGGFLFFSPEVFVGLLVYIIAFILIVFGVIQLLAMGSASRMIHVGFVAIMLPIFVIAMGVLLVIRPSFIGETIGIIAGAALIVYGVSELLSSWKMKKAIDEYDIKYPEKSRTKQEDEPVQDVKDVDYEKIDEQ